MNAGVFEHFETLDVASESVIELTLLQVFGDLERRRPEYWIGSLWHGFCLTWAGPWLA